MVDHGEANAIVSACFVIRVDEAAEDIAVLRVGGEIDAFAAPALWACAQKQFGRAGGLVVDLVEVGFFGAAGLAVLLDIGGVTRKLGLPWVVVGSRPVQRAIRVTGLESRIPACASVAEALTALRRP
jgi:anti-sigma B factor antagonist